MSRPDVIVYIDWFSPGYKAGGPVRSLVNLTRKLAPNFRFHIITSDTDYMSNMPYTEVESDRWMPFEGEHEVIYLSKSQQTYSGLNKALMGKHYDKVFVNGIYSKVFSVFPLLIHRKERSKIVVAPRGMLRESATQFKSTKKFLFLKTAQLLGLYQGVLFQATDEQEEKDIAKWFRNNKTHLAPNLADEIAPFKPVKKEQGELKICFIGRVAPEKNLLYALETTAELKSVDVQFDMYGAIYDLNYWKECAAVIDRLEENIKVNHCGSIKPDEVIPTIQTYHLLFLPTLGENFGHVILEAFMAGRPVICSDQTPWKELKSKGAGFDIPLADREAFIEHLTAYAEMDSDGFNVPCEAAYRLATRFCEDQDILEQAKAVFLP